ncbi:MAG: efflux RND transporter periplasmic adaptor subunit [Salinivirgaceae bacterium]|nr:efflux RND transporter periplasmic adaptor subunit [Salinivirgaceae bacterium]MDY0281956.1 efflux RND transporter periplasmic adaptor subunit [Salinivirgaceae bacterium]
MKNTSIIIGIILLVLVTIVAAFGIIAYAPAPIIIQGQAEATEVRVAVKIAGRMIEKNVKLGQRVEKGDKLMLLSSPEIEAKMMQVQALSDAASAQQRKANNGARQEQIQAALSTAQKAEAARELAQKTFDRVQTLFEEGVLPAQKRDEAETNLQVAKMTEEAAKSMYTMAASATRVEDKDAANAIVNQSRGAIAEVQAYQDETMLTAPLAGEISQINAELGELVTPGFPAVSIVDLDDCWVTFNVREDLLTKFAVDTEFEATFPALGNKNMTLRVTYIKPEADFATWRATKATGSFDLRSFEIRAIPTAKNSRLRPGMSAIINWDNI